MAKVGRPSKYTKELAADICSKVMDRNLTQVLRDEGMPNRDTIYKWFIKYPDFADNYARANKIRREQTFDTMEELIDQEPETNRARLKIDLLKWKLGKEEPKKYGDFLKIDEESKVTHKWESLTDEQLDKAIKEREDRVSGNS